ncbi:IS1 family transposase [Desulfotalea psychrophila]|uniref:IS1 family transposase n=1 Tax=Desulfotalea psychrophila TaxID=84980 RepID=UPI00138A0606
MTITCGQRLERQNFNLRTRLKRLKRKISGFAKSTGLQGIAHIEREFMVPP